MGTVQFMWEIFMGQFWRGHIYVHSHSVGWNSITCPHQTSGGAGKRSLAVCLGRNCFGEPLADVCHIECVLNVYMCLCEKEVSNCGHGGKEEVLASLPFCLELVGTGLAEC